jgi:hypothetical protein
MRYGELPKELGIFEVEAKEMMFYQYLPIKMPNETQPIYEQRLKCFDALVGAICCDYIGEFGLDNYVNSYVYLTAKHLYQMPNCSFNRMGWHSDGFLTDDINYIWCDKYPTIFNKTDFDLPLDDLLSMEEMGKQAMPFNDVTYKENQLLRLNQFNIHKVAPIIKGGMRTFLKVSISKDKYDLIGNSHNYLINYDWEMKQRKQERNIPQSVVDVQGANTCL